MIIITVPIIIIMIIAIHPCQSDDDILVALFNPTPPPSETVIISKLGIILSRIYKQSTRHGVCLEKIK